MIELDVRAVTVCLTLYKDSRQTKTSQRWETVSWWRHGMEKLSLTLFGRIHWATVDSRHKGPVMPNVDVFLLLCWIRCWTNIRDAGDWRHNAVYPDDYIEDWKQTCILQCRSFLTCQDSPMHSHWIHHCSPTRSSHGDYHMSSECHRCSTFTIAPLYAIWCFDLRNDPCN